MVKACMVIIAYLLHLIAGCKGEESLVEVSTYDHCICSGDIVTYECTVVGGSGGSTVWKGDFFHCSSGKQLIELVHSPLTSQSEGEVFSARICNDGDVVGRIVKVENGSFTSQLNITLTLDNAGKSIECINDDGTNTHSVGLLNITEIIDAALPLENISWMIICAQSKILFNLSGSAFSHYCHDYIISYHINTSNCGSCPTTTNHTIVTCTDILTDGSTCKFSVQSAFCYGEAQNVTITIPRCPGPGISLLITIIIPVLLVLLLLLATIIVPLLLKNSKKKIFTKDLWGSCQNALQYRSALQKEQEIDTHGRNYHAEDDTKEIKIFDNTLNGTYNLEEIEIQNEIQCQESIQESVQPITLDSLLIKLHGQVSSDWYKFGLAIGTPEDIMKQLKDYSEKDALVEILDYWLKNHYSGQPTWQDVKIALKNSGFNQINIG